MASCRARENCKSRAAGCAFKSGRPGVCADGNRKRDYKSRSDAGLDRVVIEDCSPLHAGVRLALSKTLTDQLISYRRAFDERLIALETSLADPDSPPALES